MSHILLDANTTKLFGLEIIDFENFTELVLRFSINTIILLILIRWIYYSISKRRDYLFAFILIGTVIFLLCFLLANVKLQMGFALGLFAVFGIIRYRTDAIPIKEMTYLFLTIGISVINALANKKVSYSELIFTNVVIIIATYLLEKIQILKHESSKSINYEKIELITPENRGKLIEDLQIRTGIKPINRVEIGRIDFLRDSARVKIYYYEAGNQINLAEQEEEYMGRRVDDE